MAYSKQLKINRLAKSLTSIIITGEMNCGTRAFKWITYVALNVLA